ncbi:MAG: glycosyltransferase family 39 protein [Anaerolineae bacterium]|nr:glycosyltransferase family 39 protein [Anaerolineae bacterium]
MKKSITRNEWSSLVLFLAIALGTFMRFNSALLAGFAINDGGMFAVMVDNLRANNFVLPAFSSYNDIGMPFAYPPLGFYVGALVVELFGIDSVQVVRWVPAFFASLAIPAFYLLAMRLLKDKYLASVATLFYAFIPRAFSWLIMGGGLTRSPGQFFMILALATLIRLYEEKRRTDIFLAGLFSSLAVLSHPAAAVHVFISAIWLWIMLSRKRSAFTHSIFVGVIVLTITMPWWLTVIRNHGIEVLLNAASTGGKTSAVFNLLFFTFTDELYATVIAVLGLLGLTNRLIRRDYLLPLWLALPFIVAGRGAANLAVIPLAMLAAIGFVNVVLMALQPSPADEAGVSAVERGVISGLLLYIVFSTSQFGGQLSSATLYPPDRTAMEWVRQETPSESRFLVLTGTTAVACDSVLEWFPALSGRRSVYTVQGTEWTKGAGFNDYVSSTYAVQKCYSDGDMACLDAEISRSDYDYIYASKVLRTDNCMPFGSVNNFAFFLESLKSDSGFEVIYETDEVLISRQK